MLPVPFSGTFASATSFPAIIRRSIGGGGDDAAINICKSNCPLEDCDKYCTKQVKATMSLVKKSQACSEQCLKQNLGTDCLTKCSNDISGISKDDQAAMVKVGEKLHQCPRSSDKSAADQCLAKATGTSEATVKSVYRCMSDKCLDVPDDKFMQCNFDCYRPLIYPSTKAGDDVKADIQGQDQGKVAKSSSSNHKPFGSIALAAILVFIGIIY